MICKKCCKAKHHKCRNKTKGRQTQRPTWCDCQHRMPSFTEAMQRLLTLPLLTITKSTELNSFAQNTSDASVLLTRDVKNTFTVRYF